MFHGLGDRTENVHPWSLTWNLKISSLEKEITFGNYDFRFYVKLWGVYTISQHFTMPNAVPLRSCPVLLEIWSWFTVISLFLQKKHGLSSTESREFPKKKKQAKSTTSTDTQSLSVGCCDLFAYQQTCFFRKPSSNQTRSWRFNCSHEKPPVSTHLGCPRKLVDKWLVNGLWPNYLQMGYLFGL